MVKLEKQEILKRLIKAIGIQTAREGKLPTEVSNNIQPVFSVNAKYSEESRHFTKASNGVSTIYTIPSQQKFYLTGVSLSGYWDATWNGAYIFIGYYQNGALRYAYFHEPLLGAAREVNAVRSFPFPLECDPNSNITFATSFSAGAYEATALIEGYLEDE